VNEFIEAIAVAAHHALHAPRRVAAPTDGSDLMRKRLVAWTILTSALLALAVWTVLGPPEHQAGPHLPSRGALEAAVR
jgi:hypothetical protein